jgi:hypothetical protein
MRLLISTANSSAKIATGRWALASNKVARRTEIRAQMVKPRRMALHPRHDLAQARCPRELAIEQRHELGFSSSAGAPANQRRALPLAGQTRPTANASEAHEERYYDDAWH